MWAAVHTLGSTAAQCVGAPLLSLVLLEQGKQSAPLNKDVCK